MELTFVGGWLSKDGLEDALDNRMMQEVRRTFPCMSFIDVRLALWIWMASWILNVRRHLKWVDSRSHVTDRFNNLWWFFVDIATTRRRTTATTTTQSDTTRLRPPERISRAGSASSILRNYHNPSSCGLADLLQEANQASTPAARETATSTATDLCIRKRWECCKTCSAKRNKFLIFVVPLSEPPHHPHEPSSPRTTNLISNIPHAHPDKVRI